MRESHAAIEALGARVIAVGTGSAEQAHHLMEGGIPFACLVDPEARIHQALGIGRVSWRTALSPATYLNYWRAWRRGARQGRIAGDPRRLSGVAVVDAAGRLRWRHIATTIGDYPPIARVLTEVQGLA